MRFSALVLAAVLPIGLASNAAGQPVWEAVESGSPQDQTTPDSSPPIIWSVIPEEQTSTKSGVIWDHEDKSSEEAQQEASAGVAWQRIPEGSQDFNNETEPQQRVSPKPPTVLLRALNRSIAYGGGDSGAGPDLAWKVPQGFRWSDRFWLDAAVVGASTRPPGSNFWAWNNGDATAELHLRVYQQKNWSFGINTTFRSVYQGTDFAGGSTSIGEGMASGFRFDWALSDSSGIAVGAEQLIQYDDQNDTGRNLYLVGSKGWWLGGRNGAFPLLTLTGGVGTGRFGDNPSLQFGCTSGIDASIGVGQANPLCWSPIGSVAIVINEAFSIFSEYNSQDWLAGASVAVSPEIPVRLSWGVLLGNKGTGYEYVGTENLRWFFRASVGF